MSKSVSSLGVLQRDERDRSQVLLVDDLDARICGSRLLRRERRCPHAEVTTLGDRSTVGSARMGAAVGGRMRGGAGRG